MPKFIIEHESFDGTHVHLAGETAHHIVNVLRYKVGDEVLFSDGNNTDYVTRLTYHDKSKRSVSFEILAKIKCLTEPFIYVRLFLSAIKWESFDFAVQKAVEVGVSEIVPIVTDRTIYKKKDIIKKTERFCRIAKSAAEQSMRGIVPKVAEPKILSEALRDKETISFLACCKEKESLVSVASKYRFSKTDIWIGPEGGFTNKEIERLIAKKVIPFSLGPRILRAETASTVAIASLLLQKKGEQFD